MTDPLDTELDQLFRMPPAEMVGGRNALADWLRKAGDKAAAARVKALKRPTPTAWALNQVHFEHAALLDGALAATARLRELHQRGGADSKQLSAAIDAQRNAMYAVIDVATRCCRAAGLPADGAQQRKLYTTLQAWLAGQGDEGPGRMTHEIEASGFDALAAMGPPLSSPPAASPSASAAESPREAAPAEAQDVPSQRERAVALVAERRRLARDASDELGRRRAAADRARLELDHARRVVHDAEAALADLRATLSDREAESSDLHAAVQAAQEAKQLAESALAEAEAGVPR